MGLAVHQEAAAAADAFAAVVLELTGRSPVLISCSRIEGFQKGEVGGDVLQLMALVTTGLIGAALARCAG